MLAGMESGQQDLMTAAAIARLAGVGRAAVSNWRKRHPDFPQPVGGSPASPLFDRDAVVAWLKTTGKADQLATAGQTDGGTQRVSPLPPDLAYREHLTSSGESFPGRSMTSLPPRELFARAVAALLPEDVAVSRNANGDALAILDPACEGAVLLMAVADRFGDQVRLAGQEIAEGPARIAAFNLSVNSHGAKFEVHTGDSFTDNQLAGYLGRAAAVVCEPPFDRPDWPVAELTTDPRWEFGIPAPRDGELAWVQHCYAHLRPGGTAIVAVTPRTCVATSGEHIRAALIRTGVLRAVIALPHGLSSIPGTDVCLWVLRRPLAEASPDWRNSRPERAARYGRASEAGAVVQMVDLTMLAAQADVPQEHAAWQRLLRDADASIVRAVPRLELREEGASLLPSRYVENHADVSAVDLARVTGHLERLYAQVGQGLPRFPAAASPARLASVALAELERAGALAIRSRDDAPRRGDVLLRTHGRMPIVATGTGADTGIAQVVTIDSTRIDPYFVALFLRSEVAALPVANTLGAINRDDLRRCRIPRLPLADQRRYGQAFQLLAELEQALTKLSDISTKVVEQAIYALITGAVAPEYDLPTAQATGLAPGQHGEHEDKELRR
jgi:N-6 DNA Methylase